MRIVFVSNYFNHHQSELSEQLSKQTDQNYFFIETETMEEERKKLGWHQDCLPSYVLKYYENDERAKYCKKLIDDADVVLLGTDMQYVEDRLKKRGLTFKYTERIYKKPCSALRKIVHPIKFRMTYNKYPSFYLLCAGAYVAGDFNKNGAFKGKAYKWGYFPVVKHYDSIDALIEKKSSHSILWVARMIDWKHPEIPLEIAKRLKNDGFDFHMSMIGTGSMEEQMRLSIQNENLEDYVSMCGSMPPDEVRKHMEKAEIILFTSDFNEGWGAVLNESMNSGCAVVASHAIGAVPFLLQDGQNGLIYRNGSTDDLYEKVVALLKDEKFSARLGKAAYETLISGWNAETAAKRLLLMSQSILNYDKNIAAFESGIFSPAELVSNDWYQN